MNTSDIPGYWTTTAPADREELLKEVKHADLEKFAALNDLVIYKGQLYKPEDCPCGCKMAAPDQCYEETVKGWPGAAVKAPGEDWTAEEIEEKACACPCHTYYEPF